MEVKVVAEYNENGTLIYADNFPGAYTRGKNIEEALKKVPKEITRYLVWLEQIQVSKEDISVIIVQEQKSDLNICDADSDILFNSEREKLSWKEYERLRRLAIKSAEDEKWHLMNWKNRKIFWKIKCIWEAMTRNGLCERSAGDLFGMTGFMLKPCTKWQESCADFIILKIPFYLK